MQQRLRFFYYILVNVINLSTKAIENWTNNFILLKKIFWHGDCIIYGI